jgi:type I restriction enzyme S subunit
MFALCTDWSQQWMLSSSGATAVKALYLKDIKYCPIPLPPLSEQHRIVAKVDQLMHLCDELETRLNQSKKDSEMLMQAVLHEAFS